MLQEETYLTKEEDWEVPGGYQDSLSSNTELGRAINSAVDELDTLGNLVGFTPSLVTACSPTLCWKRLTKPCVFCAQEKGVMSEAAELLKKLGVKTNIFESPPSKEEPSGES